MFGDIACRKSVGGGTFGEDRRGDSRSSLVSSKLRRAGDVPNTADELLIDAVVCGDGGAAAEALDG